ncbi:MAG: 2-C-methyl-D-erythritol 4-phosphate cytidylyltransferase [Deltaproteobacteria bacterium]|nr:2-C-methyl-D-erythritol 4-phosphate cytidylyltransferase [Deltaproteobacteria bacterium]
MNDTTRKQYLDLAGRSIMAHSVMAFDACDLIDKIFLVKNLSCYPQRRY